MNKSRFQKYYISSSKNCFVFFKFTLLDVDECSKNAHSCDVNAVCTNTPGSYSCACNARYSGNGTTCVLGKKILCL